MIALFKQKSPANIVLLLIFGLVIKLPLFLYPKEIKASTSDGSLYQYLISSIAASGDSKAILASVISFGLIYLQALMLNYMLNEYRMTARQSFLPAMAYILVTSLLPDWSYLSPALVANTLVLWTFIKMLRLYNASITNSTVYDMGLIMGFASFIYLPTLVLLVPFLLGIMILKAFRINEFFLLLLGVTTPYYFYAGYLFFTDQWSIYKLIPQYHFLIPRIQNSLWLTGSILLLGIPFLLGGYYVQTQLRSMLIQARKNWSILLIFLVFALFIPMLNSEGSLQNWVITALPFAAFHACSYLYPPRAWVSSLLFFITLTFVLAQQYFLFLR
ncbi:MAG: hypothetical protein C4330_01875 [Chitinophagaceae bacterium]